MKFLLRLSHQSTIPINGDYNSNNNDQPKEYYFDLEIPVISFKDETLRLDDEPTLNNVLYHFSKSRLGECRIRF